MQTPEFRRMMTDPAQLRQMTQLQRMFGGGMPGMGGGASAFPAPGATDTTPGQDSNRVVQPTSQPPFNPMAMFANPAAAGSATATNPFAALFNPGAVGQTPTATPPPPASAGQGTPAGPGTPAPAEGQPLSQQPQPGQPGFNPFANVTNPFLTNPQMMQQMLQAMGGGANPNPSTAASDPASNPFAALFGPGGMMGGQGFGGPATATPVDTRPPEERYAEQLRQLNDMGFYEYERNLEALRRTGGSVQGAVEYLLTH